MEKVLKFINDFFEAEFVSSKSRFDKELPEEEQRESTKLRMESFFHSLEANEISMYKRKKTDLTEKSLIKYRKPERVLKRELYLVEKYEKPKLGDVYRRIVKSQYIWLCYAGEDEKDFDREPQCSRIFVVAETDEGLRIMKIIIFRNGVGFKNADKSEPVQYRISDYGKKLDSRTFKEIG